MPSYSKTIFLTFDDGPSTATTPFILEILKANHAKATFFCLGKRLKQHRLLSEQIMCEGHLIANHGYLHLDGWRCRRTEYIQNIAKGFEELAYLGINHHLYRPPYGRISIVQKKTIPSIAKVVMWSLMSGDFDASLSKEKCLKRLIHKTKSGDIVVFHDNEKAIKCLTYVLPRYLTYCKANGYKFQILNTIT